MLRLRHLQCEISRADAIGNNAVAESGEVCDGPELREVSCERLDNGLHHPRRGRLSLTEGGNTDLATTGLLIGFVIMMILDVALGWRKSLPP